jgi:hypothetical protein
MTNILALHKILHETKQRGDVGVIVKLDFEKDTIRYIGFFLVERL